jgi:hypothetical protein
MDTNNAGHSFNTGPYEKNILVQLDFYFVVWLNLKMYKNWFSTNKYDNVTDMSNFNLSDILLF